MSTGKTFRHGSNPSPGCVIRGSATRKNLRRRLSAQKLRVTQATLSRDLQELRLVKTQSGYKPAAALRKETAPLPPLARALANFFSIFVPPKICSFQNSAQRRAALAAAVDGANSRKSPETIAGDDTV